MALKLYPAEPHMHVVLKNNMINSNIMAITRNIVRIDKLFCDIKAHRPDSALV